MMKLVSKEYVYMRTDRKVVHLKNMNTRKGVVLEEFRGSSI